MKDRQPALHSWFKMGLRSQQVVLFLLVSLTPLLVVSLTIKVLGGNALRSSVGEGLALLAREKLSRADRAISHRIANIRKELPNLTTEVIRSNGAIGDSDVLMDVQANLEDSIRLIETYAGGVRRGRFRHRQQNIHEVTITNAEGFVLRSTNPALDYNEDKISPSQVKGEIWHTQAFNNGYGSYFVEDVQYDATRNLHFLSVALPIRKSISNSFSDANRSVPTQEIRRNRRGTPRSSSNSVQNVVGVLRIVILLPELNNVVESLQDMEKAHTILTSQAGKIIAVTEGSGYQIGDRLLSEHATAEAIIQSKREDGDTYGYEAEGETDRFHESRVYGWARTKLSRGQPWKKDQNFSHWFIFVSYPSSEAFAGVTKLNQYVFWVTIISCIIVVPIAYAVAQQISQPVMQLAQAAKRIGQEASEVIQEDSDQVRKQITNMQWYQSDEAELISVTSKNEVGILAQEFNDMHRNLKIAVEKLISAEEQMTTIVDCLSEGLIVVDIHDHILYFNPAAKHLLNFSDTTEFPDRFSELLEVTNLSILANTQGMDARATVEINLDKDKDNRILRVVASHFFSISTPTNGDTVSDENTDLAGTVYVFDDITREHEIDKMKSDFVALVSHELRTPLTSIKGFVSLVLDGKTGPLNQDQQQSLTRAHRQSKRLEAMINDLLDISRIEAGRIVMKLEPVKLAEIVQQRLEEIKPQADEKALKLGLSVEPNLPDLTGDEEHLGQILTNLIGNAVKFTPSNGEVTVKLSRKECPLEDTNIEVEENDGIHVEVIDTGPGIPVQERENVFDKFQQLSNIQTREQGGTGLGLSIARGFVEAHKGKIWVGAGENDKGCNFQFWIPFLS
ncbi:MAG: ATP-binding protein [Candidatus Poribacteria bacterium]|nr:ATP-binding protein [Candidatus Poribacteria bacterium]